MDIVKKNLVSIICGVIAIVAIVATFYPMNGEFDKLNKQLVERNTAYTTAEQILAKTRQMPVTDLVSSVEPPPLKYFPSPAITKTAKTFLDQLIAQSRGVLEEAVKINKLESVVGQNQATLLTPDSLPEPKNNADNTFKKALVPEYEFLKLTILGAGYPPTADEIKKADDKLLADPRVKKQLDANQQVLNEEAVQKAYQEDSAALPQKLRTEMAMKSRIYLDPEALIAPKEITTVSQSPSPTSIWFAQAALWVQEDTCRAISEANQSSANVLDAPIKRLLSFTLPFGPGMYVRPVSADPAAAATAAPTGRFGGNTGGNDGGAPNNTEPKRNFTISATGRTCNIMYDVISFSLVLHVDQTKIPQVIAAMSRNRYISVTEATITRLDTKPLVDAGFVYGPAAIAELTLKCEAIQMREWTVPWMPKEIKDMLIGPGVDFVSQLTVAKKEPG